MITCKKLHDSINLDIISYITSPVLNFRYNQTRILADIIERPGMLVGHGLSDYNSTY